MLDDRLADALAAAGWDGDRIATELLMFIPGRFRDAYSNLFHAALSADAGTDGRGRSAEETGRLGRALGRPTSGQQIHKKSGGGKRYRTHWHVGDERALKLKDKIDKRLRALARDIETGLDDLAGVEADGRVRPTCAGCGQFLGADWRFCPGCGTSVEEGETS